MSFTTSASRAWQKLQMMQLLQPRQLSASLAGRGKNATSPSAGVAADRVGWVDYAKGICIIAVVTMYATHHVHQLAQRTGWMQYVVDFAQPFRMPDFFLIAGLFVPRVIDRPLRAYIDTKVLYFAYFYALWVSFKFLFMQGPALMAPGRLALIPDYFQLYLTPPSGPLWFIYLLALFFIAVRLARRVPALLVLACAAALQAANFDTGVILFDKFSHYFVFFYSGYLFAPRIFRVADWAQAHRRITVAILAGWFVLNAALVAQHWAALPGIGLMLGYAGAFAVLLLATLLARVSSMQWLRYLGQHSIVVYLGFVIPLALMRWLIVDSDWIKDLGTLALTVTVISVAGSILLYWAVRATPLGFLFARPAWTSISPRPAQRRVAAAGHDQSAPMQTQADPGA